MDAEASESRNPEEHDYSSSLHGRLRFKGSHHRQSEGQRRRHRHTSREREKTGGRERNRDKDKHRDKKRRTRKHRASRRHTTSSPDNAPDPVNGRLSPGAAFRESLFDALGDDEGAAYWESVYGQPIHTYAVPQTAAGPNGELEQMSDEEYAAHVRARMWERTREGMLEAQERLRAERARHKQRQQDGYEREQERRRFESAMEESLRRGAARRRSKTWTAAWKTYLARWDEISGRAGGDQHNTNSSSNPTPLRNMLFWPVESGKRKDVASDSVEEFMRHAPPPADFLATLKAERIRWHPDKIQHRYGALGIDETVMRSVTEVFQIVDRLWGEERARDDAKP
ncbi:hypothetical protein NUU61_010215 [Penicillium alfredii]|uniref:Uncharacterized protein n=1 Tax=Penicillium alfredii TaxID=1506179 RepID=A0A9W9EHL0_9EURO|nr:uncharacterized protein NUU61_010215 [Penicillium alfredii]KAJ5081951.1 hypothetical protein NUU61_010215 [Penicillium alfredii]